MLLFQQEGGRLAIFSGSTALIIRSGGAQSAMPQRRCPKGTRTPVPIRTGAEYIKAVEELKVLQKAPLGTEQTEGLQDLVEAILEYEARLGRMDGNSSIE
jgi:hypothetical protein